MENNSTNILKVEESMDVVDAGKTRERETNVSEKETAAVRRDGGPLTTADQQLRQESSAASEPPS